MAGFSHGNVKMFACPSVCLCEKQVTISLALSIVTLLGACWTILHIVPIIGQSHYYRSYDFPDFHDDNGTETDISWPAYYEVIQTSFTVFCLFVCFFH